MPFYFFQWTDELIEHLAENGVTPDEFEQVVCHPMRVGRGRTSDRPVALGLTDQGRVILCVYEPLDEDTILPVTAFEPDEV